jgi:hypothetical protein
MGEDFLIESFVSQNSLDCFIRFGTGCSSGSPGEFSSDGDGLVADAESELKSLVDSAFFFHNYLTSCMSWLILSIVIFCASELLQTFVNIRLRAERQNN